MRTEQRLAAMHSQHIMGIALDLNQVVACHGHEHNPAFPPTTTNWRFWTSADWLAGLTRIRYCIAKDGTVSAGTSSREQFRAPLG